MERHLKTTKHMNLLSQMKTQPSLPMILERAAGKSIEDQAMAAEIYFAKFVAEQKKTGTGDY